MAESNDEGDGRVTEYAECLEHFARFLAANGHTGTITWTFLDDYSFHRRDRILVVSLEHVSGNARLVERVHAASAHERGLLLSLVGIDDNRLLCTAWVPDSDDEAQRSLTWGTKFSVPATPRPIAVVSPEELAGLQTWLEAFSFTRDMFPAWIHTRSEAARIAERSP